MEQDIINIGHETNVIANTREKVMVLGKLYPICPLTNKRRKLILNLPFAYFNQRLVEKKCICIKNCHF